MGKQLRDRRRGGGIIGRRNLRVNCAALVEQLERRQLLAVFNPLTSAALTTALQNAQLGDTIVLQAGTTYVGTYTLRPKTEGSGYITIQSSQVGQLPAGERVTPDDAVHMSRIQAPGFNAQAVKTAAGAHHYQFVGIEFVGPANNSDLTTLVELGNDAQDEIAEVPHHIHIDRSYFRPNTPSANIRRAIGLHTQYTDITNSWIEEIHEGSDSNAIAGWNGLGNYNIINNHLEGAGENVMFGGATNRMPDGRVVSDVVIRGNHIIKPLHWRDGSRGYKPTVKNLFELKQGARFLVEGNVMENNWVSGQSGVAIVLKLGDYNVSPQNVTEDIILRNNIIRHANGAIALQGRDYASGSPEGLVRRLSFHNNVFDDINGKWSTSGTGGGTFNIYMTQGPKDVVMDHNTFFNGYTTIEVDSAQYPTSGFKFTNNIVDHNTYGVRSTSGTGNVTFSTYFSDAGHEFKGNLLVNVPYANRNSYSSRPGNYLLYQSGDPDLWGSVGFVDMAGGNYRLSPASAYRNAGTDGMDVGANIDALDVATAGAISGVWASPLTGAVVNAGNPGAVKVSTVTLQFNQPFTMPANAATLIRRNPDGTKSAVALTGTPSADQLSYTFTFGGVNTTAGELNDGVYEFTLPTTLRNGFELPPVTVPDIATKLIVVSGSAAAAANALTVDVAGAAVGVWSPNGAAANLSLTVKPGTVLLVNSAQQLAGLTLDRAVAKVAGGGANTLLVKNLTLTNGGQLDLADNAMVLNYGGASPIDTVRQQLRSGGIFSSAGVLGRAIGYAEASDFGVTEWSGQPADGTSLVLKYTVAGDANLSGGIDADDRALTDRGRAMGLGKWLFGDFNYDGVVDDADYAILNGSPSATPAPAAPPASGEESVVATTSVAAPAVAPVLAEPAVTTTESKLLTKVVGPRVATRGKAVAFQLSVASKVKAVKSAATKSPVYRYLIDWDNDGEVDRIIRGRGALVVSHAFAKRGVNKITVTAVDADGNAVGAPRTVGVRVV